MRDVVAGDVDETLADVLSDLLPEAVVTPER